MRISFPPTNQNYVYIALPGRGSWYFRGTHYLHIIPCRKKNECKHKTVRALYYTGEKMSYILQHWLLHYLIHRSPRPYPITRR